MNLEPDYSKMSWLHRTWSEFFNHFLPVEAANSPYRGAPGAAGFHPDMPWLDRLSVIHDAEDDLIRSGQSPMTFHENDERFIRAMHIWEREYPFKNHLDEDQAIFKDRFIPEIFEAYRYSRGEDQIDKQILLFRNALNVKKAMATADVVA